MECIAFNKCIILLIIKIIIFHFRGILLNKMKTPLSNVSWCDMLGNNFPTS